MALNKAGLKASIKNLINALKVYDGSTGQTQDEAIEKFANDLSDYIDTYVKTATVNVTTTCPAGAGTGFGGVS